VPAPVPCRTYGGRNTRRLRRQRSTSKENRVSQLTSTWYQLPPSTDALCTTTTAIRIVTCRGHFVIAHSLGSRAVLICCPRLAWLLLRSSLPSALQLYHQQRKQVFPSPHLTSTHLHLLLWHTRCTHRTRCTDCIVTAVGAWRATWLTASSQLQVVFSDTLHTPTLPHCTAPDRTVQHSRDWAHLTPSYLRIDSNGPTNLILAFCQDFPARQLSSLNRHEASKHARSLTRSPFIHSHVRSRLVLSPVHRTFLLHSLFLDKLCSSFIVYRPSPRRESLFPLPYRHPLDTFLIFAFANHFNLDRRLLPPRCKSQTSSFHAPSTLKPGEFGPARLQTPCPSTRSLDRWLSFANKVLPGLVAATKLPASIDAGQPTTYILHNSTRYHFHSPCF
jgi:hypothetical protein